MKASAFVFTVIFIGLLVLGIAEVFKDVSATASFDVPHTFHLSTKTAIGSRPLPTTAASSSCRLLK
jgi:hypothetical protein